MHFELFDMIYFHDSSVLEYKKKNNNIVLTFSDGSGNNKIYNLVFKNARVNECIDNKISFDLEYAKSFLDTGEIWIYSADYGKYKDNKYFLKLEFVGIPEILFNNYKLKNKSIIYQGENFYKEKYFENEYVTMMIVADNIMIEEFIDNKELLEKYDRNSKYYRNNYNNIVKYLNDDVISFINNFYMFVYVCYDKDKNLMLYFKDDISNDKKFVYLKLINSDIKLLENDLSDDFVIKNKIYYIRNSNNIRIYRNAVGVYEIGLLISEIREVVVECSDIECGIYDINELEDVVSNNNI